MEIILGLLGNVMSGLGEEKHGGNQCLLPTTTNGIHSAIELLFRRPRCMLMPYILTCRFSRLFTPV